MSRQPRQHSVILDVLDARWPYYVQVAVDAEDGAWVEAVSNEFIDVAEARLTARQMARLAQLGFTPPGDSPNYQRLFGTPVDWTAVAHLLIEALVSVYDVTERNELELHVFPHWTVEDEL